MQVGEKVLAGAQHGHFPGLRFLDLHDQVRFRKNRRRLVHDAATGLFVFGGEESGTGPRIPLHQHGVAVFDQLPGGGRRQGHAVLLGFDFAGDSDDGLFHTGNDSITRGAGQRRNCYFFEASCDQGLLLASFSEMQCLLKHGLRFDFHHSMSFSRCLSSQRMRLLTGVVPWGILVGAFLGIAAAPLGLYCSFIERLTHIRFYGMAALTLSLGWWIVRKQRIPALVAAALLVGTLPAVFRYSRMDPGQANPQSGSGNMTLTVASWNVHSSNPTRERAVVWLRDCPVDILLLTEVNPGWAKTLKEVTARWPHQICEPRAGGAGIWLLSRWPLTGLEAGGISAGEKRPWIGCTVQGPQGPVRLMGMHPRTPRGGDRFHERNAQLDKAADFAAASTGPVVVLGDFNCTPFSPWFDRLLERGRLKDSAMGFGLVPTWQSAIWFLPIDHILIGGPIEVVNHHVHGDNLGSDHSPVMAMLRSVKIAERLD
jgi:endonuclease/exonuclease/phosphatase (EEP) superfamily protein YafD